MKNAFLILFSLLVSGWSMAQDSRQMLRGKVLYRSSNVPNENVINSTSGIATITDDNGEFMIAVKEGDQLVFTAVNYQLEVVTVTPEILANNRLVVEVDEKVQELDEVVVTPENQERFLQVKNEDFKEFNYGIDRGTEVENIANSQITRGMKDGLNFVNIFRALFKPQEVNGQQRAPLKVSEVLRHVYDDEFFVVDLKLPQDKIDAFLLYCDDKIPSQTLLRKENEFQLIDFLVTQSKDFLATLEEE
ncbi:carboxypeptidase-like regulatory domain-containing protein [Flagellimonas halotolerans]|uniref:Carboxypeptidase-like regulatory domain-containing protein n=1 Tax=Flagellimonas halotolerans TaxID=3112164 RepID=A0ABU6IQE5_9FLAO|nr:MULTISPECIES: carboxypeptidase-like regulatory domain-containing protein [unclassified Allomuricauda]MEC3965373.1 carboxypeptidase-like regulatory domain-containing protein [Muricauda sp. SYSU M86414]MEC4265239.1 carboxypeptidase-like regulatory domain-containing protein [Muricauda sp. SYSU M84420]